MARWLSWLPGFRAMTEMEIGAVRPAAAYIDGSTDDNTWKTRPCDVVLVL
jgi:hypothetical protein